MRRKVEPFVIAGGVGITTFIGAIVILRADALVGIVAAFTAGAGHDPGDALSNLFRGAPLCGSIVALMCTTMLCGWLARRRFWDRRGATHNIVLNRTNCLIVVVGSLGAAIVAGLSTSTPIIETCWHVGVLLSTKWQHIGAYMSSIGWYVAFLAGAAFLCGSLIGLLGMVAGGLSGGLFGIVAGILEGRGNRAD